VWVVREKEWRIACLADPLFDVLLTLDKNVRYQQNLDTRRIALLIVRARSNRIQDLLPVVPECLAALGVIEPRQVILVGSSSLSR